MSPPTHFFLIYDDSLVSYKYKFALTSSLDQRLKHSKTWKN